MCTQTHTLIYAFTHTHTHTETTHLYKHEQTHLWIWIHEHTHYTPLYTIVCTCTNYLRYKGLKQNKDKTQALPAFSLLKITFSHIPYYT